MKQFKKLICLTIILTLTVACLVACKKTKEIKCPFTEITWENTLDDIKALGGKLNETVDSSYKGDTYDVKATYNGLDGIVQYMFDANDKLVCMAFNYTSDDAEDLNKVYKTLLAETEDTYGESGYHYELATSGGHVWYSDNGNIILFYISTGEVKTIQYSYKHPDVSEKE